MATDHLEIVPRFRGPPRSGNGGYTCGRLASRLDGTVAARLKAPPPLGTPLRLDTDGGIARLFAGDTLVGEAKPATLDLQVPPAPTLAQARDAVPAFIGFRRHSFPGCFVCGPEREPKDGLCIFPGPVEGTALIAAPWTPDPSLADETGVVRPEFVWSALDCPGAFAVMPRLADGVAVVLGELTASLAAPVRANEPHIVAGWSLGQEGRKHLAGTAVYTEDGRVLASARAVWIEVPQATWG